MIIYNSGPYWKEVKENILICPNVLISMHLFPKVISDLKKRDDLFYNDINIMIDNGAFSQWNSNKDIIKNSDYLDFCDTFYKEYSDKFKNIYFISLDNIPGKVNQKPSFDQIRQSEQITYNNYIEGLQRGVKNLVPVFHQHEDIESLKKFINHTDYICISPANDETTNSRKKWLSDVFMELKFSIKTHALAAMSPHILEVYPFYSVDSTVWLNPKKFAELIMFNFKSFYRLKFKKDMKNFNLYSLKDFYEISTFLFDNDKCFNHSISNIKDYEVYLTNLWEERGLVWN